MVLIHNKDRRGISNLEKVALVTGSSSGIRNICITSEKWISYVFYSKESRKIASID